MFLNGSGWQASKAVGGDARPCPATQSLLLFNLLTFPFMIFSGFFVNIAALPSYMSWFPELSMFKWINQLFAPGTVLCQRCSPASRC